MISLSTVLLQYVRTYRGRLLYRYLQIFFMRKSTDYFFISVFSEQAKKGRLYLTVLLAAARGGVYGVKALRIVFLASNWGNSFCFSLYILTSSPDLDEQCHRMERIMLPNQPFSRFLFLWAQTAQATRETAWLANNIHYRSPNYGKLIGLGRRARCNVFYVDWIQFRKFDCKLIHIVYLRKGHARISNRLYERKI